MAIDKKAQRVEGRTCPNCKALNDGQTPVSGDLKQLPDPGDFSVCAYCGAILRFDDRLLLRAAAKEEIASLPTESREYIAIARAAVKRLGLERPK